MTENEESQPSVVGGSHLFSHHLEGEAGASPQIEASWDTYRVSAIKGYRVRPFPKPDKPNSIGKMAE